MIGLIHAALALQEHHITLHSVLVDIPHDATAIVVYLVSGAAIFWVFKAGLKEFDGEEPKQD